ncbi:MAG: GNAT family N-acetyltransferase [Acidimicrobiales bacterium]
MNPVVHVRPPTAGAETDAVVTRLRSTFGATVARRGALIDPAAGSLVGAYRHGRLAGVLAYDVEDDRCEVVAIESFDQRQGIGTALFDNVFDTARRLGCRQLWVVTTNDNTGAFAFYQRWGMDLVAVRLGAVDAARAGIKLTIPLVGDGEVPIRHELELAVEIGQGASDHTIGSRR